MSWAALHWNRQWNPPGSPGGQRPLGHTPLPALVSSTHRKSLHASRVVKSLSSLSVRKFFVRMEPIPSFPLMFQVHLISSTRDSHN